MGAPVGQAWLLAAAGPRRLPAVPAPGSSGWDVPVWTRPGRGDPALTRLL